MFLKGKERKLFFLLLTIIVLVTTGFTPLSKTLPPEIQNIFLNTKTVTPQVQGVNTDKKTQELQTVKVIRIIDGDTIIIEGGMRVRYIGINSPELTGTKDDVQCFSIESTKRNKQLVENKIIQLEKDVSDTDKYDRLLRYVYVSGVMINEQLVREGFAYTKAYPPDIKHQSKLKSAEEEAIRFKSGLWKYCENRD